MTTMTKVQPPTHAIGRTPGPAGGTVPIGTAKSGYAAQIRPDLVTGEEAAGNVVPIASDSGVQTGRVPPAQRKTTNYRGVSAAEADKLFHDRLHGKAPRIEGGLDGPGKAKTEISQYEDVRMELHDTAEETYEPPQAPIDLTNVEGLAKLLTAVQQAQPGLLKPKMAEAVGVLPNGQVVERAPQPVKNSPQSAYLASRARVQLQIEGAGTYSIPAIDVIKAGFGVLVLLPCGNDDATFIPNAGAAVRVSYKGQNYNCFYPGVAGEIPALGIMVLSMIDKDSDEA